MDNKGEFLVATLPSGRTIRYYRPTLRAVVTPYGEKEEIHYWAAGLGGKGIEENKTYGGSLVENIVQGTARDIMANGMLEAEKSGFPVVLTVHDELVTEVDHRAVTMPAAETIVAGEQTSRLSNVNYAHPPLVDTLIKAMCTLPKWADGCPIAAEGWSGFRYRK
jgi:DNA polymerase